ATVRFTEVIHEALEKAGCSLDQVALLVPHQANMRIADAVGQRLGLAPERVFQNIQRYGNTTAASIPIALAEAEAEGRLRRGARLGRRGGAVVPEAPTTEPPHR